MTRYRVTHVDGASAVEFTFETTGPRRHPRVEKLMIADVLDDLGIQRVEDVMKALYREEQMSADRRRDLAEVLAEVVMAAHRLREPTSPPEDGP